MKKNFLEAIRDLFGVGESPKEEVHEDLSEVGKWQAKVSDRCYNKNDLVCFVQYGHDRNEDDVYFMCGYLNADGTRFRDLSTGAVYGVFDAPYPDRSTMIGESMRSTISYGKRKRLINCDLFAHYKTSLVLEYHRFQCKDCNHVFNDSTNIVLKNERIAKSTKIQVLLDLKEDHTFKYIAKKKQHFTTNCY